MNENIAELHRLGMLQGIDNFCLQRRDNQVELSSINPKAYNREKISFENVMGYIGDHEVPPK